MSHWQFQMEKSPVNPYESDALPTVVMVYGGPIWRFFELVVFHNGRSPKAKCLSCGHYVDRSRATTMKWHLARCHPLKFNMYRHLVKEGRPAIPLTIAIPKEIGSDSGNEHADVEGFFFKCFNHIRNWLCWTGGSRRFLFDIPALYPSFLPGKQFLKYLQVSPDEPCFKRTY